MTIQEIMQILGGIGVIGSLIYIAIQIRNNSRAMRAATYQQLIVSSVQGWLGMAHDGETTDIVLRGMDDFFALSRVEKARFRFLVMAYVGNFANGWFQLKIGTLRDNDWKAITGDMDAFFSTPGTQVVWPLVKSRFNPEFTAFVDQILLRQAAAAANHRPSPPVIVTESKVKNNDLR